MRLVGVHQPNFLPWLPFFAKMASCQAFVFLDDVQYPKNSWVNRVRGGSEAGSAWMTVPVQRNSHTLIREVRIDYTRDWDRKLLAGLHQNYGRHPFFEQIFPVLSRQIQRRPPFLLDLNLPLLEWLAQLLELPVQLYLSSQLPVQGISSARLVALCKRLNATDYLAGQGSAAYEDLQVYREAGIAYHLQQVSAPVYARWDGSPAVPGLSVVDALMNLGPAETRRLLEVESP